MGGRKKRRAGVEKAPKASMMRAGGWVDARARTVGAAATASIPN